MLNKRTEYRAFYQELEAEKLKNKALEAAAAHFEQDTSIQDRRSVLRKDSGRTLPIPIEDPSAVQYEAQDSMEWEHEKLELLALLQKERNDRTTERSLERARASQVEALLMKVETAAGKAEKYVEWWKMLDEWTSGSNELLDTQALQARLNSEREATQLKAQYARSDLAEAHHDLCELYGEPATWPSHWSSLSSRGPRL